MPRWKALPDELDPQVREFASRLRRLVDRGGLSVAALADRTGYSRTSWERYLNGRLLAPKGAVVALAEVTGANPVHLTTMWELAERAWSRSELRHDRTMEAIRTARVRAALGEFGPVAPAAEAVEAAAGGAARKPGGATPTPGTAGPAGVSPTVPPQSTASDVDVREGAARAAGAGRAGLAGPGDPAASGTGASRAPARPGAASCSGPPYGPSGSGSPASAVPAGSSADSGSGHRSYSGHSGVRPYSGARSGSGPAAPKAGNSWGLAGYRGPSPVAGRLSGGTAPPSDGAGRTTATPGGPAPAAQNASAPAAANPYGGQPTGGGTRGRRLAMFLTGLTATLAVLGAGFYLTGGNGHARAEGAARPPSSSADARPHLPPGVKCAGAACTGKDAETMGCTGDLVTTVRSVTVGGTVLELRYSGTCGAAWGRITQAARGDRVQVAVGTLRESGTITSAGDTIAYTPMAAVTDAAQAKACATLASGQRACTR